MCPVCLAAAALLAGKTAGTVGLAALVAGKFRAGNVTKQVPKPTKEKEDRNVHHHDRN
jgi:hypothetical protein